MMPGAQRGEIELGKLRMLELLDEHGRNAVHQRAALRLNRLEDGQRFEGGGGVDHGRAVHHAGEIGHHHAEAVIQRHRDAQPVARAQAHALADEARVVDDVAV